MHKSFRFSQGLAQIPLMIVLLLLAIAVPVATKYIQTSNLDTRNLAAGNNCRNAKGTIVKCSDPKAVTGPGKTATGNNTGGSNAGTGGGVVVSGLRDADCKADSQGKKDGNDPKNCYAAAGKCFCGQIGSGFNFIPSSVGVTGSGAGGGVGTTTTTGSGSGSGTEQPAISNFAANTDPDLVIFKSCLERGNSVRDCQGFIPKGKYDEFNQCLGRAASDDERTPAYDLKSLQYCSDYSSFPGVANGAGTLGSDCDVPGTNDCTNKLRCTKVGSGYKWRTYVGCPVAPSTSNPGTPGTSTGGSYTAPVVSTKPKNTNNGGNNNKPNPPIGGSCVAQCPSPKDKTILNNCMPADSDGTPDTKKCAASGAVRYERCGGSGVALGCWLCPKAGGNWVKQTDMSKCPAPSPTAAPDPKCNWCGTSCLSAEQRKGKVCTEIFPVDKICVNVAGKCTIKPMPACNLTCVVGKACRVVNGKPTCVVVPPTPTLTPTSTPASVKPMVLNYQLSFGGVNANSAQCVVNWPLQFIVMSGGVTATYSNVVPQLQSIGGSKLVVVGSLTLTGFTKSNGVAVFVKGPKHLQVKYGINNQTAAYNKAGGELTLTADKLTSPVYNFTGYPLVPGDVVGSGSDVQDGWINGVDFSYVKAKSLVHETITSGGYLKGDLDGNCQVNSNDVNLLKISLQDRQGQIY